MYSAQGATDGTQTVPGRVWVRVACTWNFEIVVFLLQ